MKLIDILDMYIKGESSEANLALQGHIKVLIEEPNQHVHPLLNCFSEKKLHFKSHNFRADILALEQDRVSLSTTADLYLWALYMMKAQNPAVARFIDITLVRVLS